MAVVLLMLIMIVTYIQKAVQRWMENWENRTVYIDPAPAKPAEAAQAK